MAEGMSQISEMLTMILVQTISWIRQTHLALGKVSLPGAIVSLPGAIVSLPRAIVLGDCPGQYCPGQFFSNAIDTNWLFIKKEAEVLLLSLCECFSCNMQNWKKLPFLSMDGCGSVALCLDIQMWSGLNSIRRRSMWVSSYSTEIAYGLFVEMTSIRIWLLFCMHSPRSCFSVSLGGFRGRGFAVTPTHCSTAVSSFEGM